MGAPLGTALGVSAKTSPPSAEGAIPRPRLFKALDRLKARPITWVHAPAGAGKTTLLASYARDRAERVLWYDVDPSDADPSTLFHDLRVAAERLGGRTLSLPSPMPGSPESQRAFAGHFFTALFAELPERTILVVDNYQYASHASAWNEGFRELCDALGRHVRLVVLSRTAPPPTLARHCGSGQLEVVDWISLRLDQREIESLLARHGRTLDSAELLALTDGWAVAVTMLARSDAPVTSLGRPITGARTGASHELNNDSIFRYLAGEIFDRLDAPARELLLELSLLPSFTAAMAESLTGASALPILLRLHAEHLLVERHGETAFRVHDLFRAFSRDRARATMDDEAWTTLQLKSARLLEADGQLSAAVDVLVSARAWLALAELIERSAPMLASQARFPTLAAAIEQLPHPERSERPWIVYWEAVATLGRPGGRSLDLAQEAFAEFEARGDPAGTLLAWSLVVRAIIIAGEDFTPLASWLAKLEALALEPPDPMIAVQTAIGELFAYAFWATGSARSIEVADRALDLVARFGSTEDRVHTWSMGLLVYYLGGRTERAADMRRLSRKLLDDSGDNALVKLGYMHTDALLQMWSASYRAALHVVEEGTALAASSGVEVWTASLITIGVMSAIGLGQLDVAEQMLDRLGVHVAAGATRYARAQYGYLRGWLAFERGDTSAAMRWHADSMKEATRLGFTFARYQEEIAHVVFCAARGDRREIEAAIQRLDTFDFGVCPWAATVPADIVKAYARARLGEDISDELRAGFAHQRNAGGTLAFTGARMTAEVLLMALELDIEPELVRSMIEKLALEPGPEAASLPSWPWRIRIKTFGALQLVVRDRQVEFGRKTPWMPLALLKLLAAHAEPVSAARMRSALWPGKPAASRASLDTVIYRLRTLLDDDAAIETAGGRIALAPFCFNDVRAFSIGCDRIAALDGRATTTVLDRHERRLLEIYTGPFAADDPLAALTRPRQELRVRFARAIDDLARLWIQSGDPARAERLIARARSCDELAPIEATALGAAPSQR